MTRAIMKLAAGLAAIAAMGLAHAPAAAQTDIEPLYTMLDDRGQVITMRGGAMHTGDEYIARDDSHYRIISVDDISRTAVAQYLGSARIDPEALAAFRGIARAEEKVKENASDEKKLICMYSTHSDECYVPTDGKSSKWEDAGIYDVGNSLKEELEKLGIQAVYSQETFHPHDADAYTRSRTTAEELLKKGPDALLDIHRDATPADQYETTVDGEDISMVRLFVGRSNQNAAANKAFAQEIKRTADKTCPGLIKDIYIGKGNYNQELYPQALLLEFGTHKIEKEKAIAATEYMAQVLSDVLYGPAAKAESTRSEKKSSAATGIGWAIGLAVLAAVIYALISTGGFKGMKDKLKRGASEISGGLFGKRPKK